MTKHKRGRRHRNHLYALRRSRRYLQKHVAHLLGLSGRKAVSRYETGSALPSLRTALLMQIVLGATLADIFPDLYRELQALAVERETQLSPLLGKHIRGRVHGRD